MRGIITKAVDTLGGRQMLKQVTTIPLYRNAFYLMLNSGITSLLNFFFWIVVARFYSEAELGSGAAIFSAINLLTIMSIVGLNLSVIRFLSHSDEPHRLINFSFTASGLISLAVATIFIAAVDLLSPALTFVKLNTVYFLTFVVLAVLSISSKLMDSVFVARRSAGFVLIKDVIFSSLKIPLVILLGMFLHAFGVVASWVVALGIAFVISFFLFLPKVEAGYKPVPTLKLGQFRSMWQYSAGSYLASLFGKAPIMILPLMVASILGTESNAYFYIAWMIASVLFTISGSVSRSLFAEGSYSEGSIKENLTRSLKFTFLLLLLAVIVLIVTGKWILLAFGESYSANALVLLWLLILASLPRGINQVYFSVLRVQGRLKELVMIRGFVAVSVLTMSFFVISSYGIISVGFVWLGVQIVVSIALVLMLGSQVRKSRRIEGDDWEDGDYL